MSDAVTVSPGPAIGKPLSIGLARGTRRIRGAIGERIVLDTGRAVLISEEPRRGAVLAVPVTDLVEGLLVPTGASAAADHPGADSYFDLVEESRTVRDAAWSYQLDELRDHVGLSGDAVERWLEEDEAVVAHPRSPFHRVDAIRSTRHVVVRAGGRVIAETRHPVALFETNLPTRWYVPEQDVRAEFLVDVDLQTGCPYKGIASYRALAAQPEVPVQWRYPRPLPEVAAIAGHVAFYDELVEVSVDGVTETPSGALDRPSADTSVDGTETVTVQDAERFISAARRLPVAEGELRYEPSRRRVRGTIADVTVVDSYAPVLIWEPGPPVPRYAFPRADVRVDLLSPAAGPPVQARPGADAWLDLTLDGEVLPALAWTYAVPELADLIAFDWFLHAGRGVEHWYEEDEEIFVHPRDPYKRIDPIRSSRHVEVFINGEQVADTHQPLMLFETPLPTRYYIPAEDVQLDRLEPSDLTTRCPYKGIARYWSFRGADGSLEQDVVWSYPEPIRAAEPIRDLLAFYNEYVDISVDGVPQERPRSHFGPQPRSA